MAVRLSGELGIRTDFALPSYVIAAVHPKLLCPPFTSRRYLRRARRLFCALCASCCSSRSRARCVPDREPRGSYFRSSSGYPCTIGESQWHCSERRRILRCNRKDVPHFAPVLLDPEPFMVPGVTNNGVSAVDLIRRVPRHIDFAAIQPSRSLNQDEGMVSIIIGINQIAGDLLAIYAFAT